MGGRCGWTERGALVGLLAELFVFVLAEEVLELFLVLDLDLAEPA